MNAASAWPTTPALSGRDEPSVSRPPTSGKTLSTRSSRVVIPWFLNEDSSSSLVMICVCDDLSDICAFLEPHSAYRSWFLWSLARNRVCRSKIAALGSSPVVSQKSVSVTKIGTGLYTQMLSQKNDEFVGTNPQSGVFFFVYLHIFVYLQRTWPRRMPFQARIQLMTGRI
jgi:hypothetical protein